MIKYPSGHQIGIPEDANDETSEEESQGNNYPNGIARGRKQTGS